MTLVNQKLKQALMQYGLRRNEDEKGDPIKKYSRLNDLTQRSRKEDMR